MSKLLQSVRIRTALSVLAVWMVVIPVAGLAQDAEDAEMASAVDAGMGVQQDTTASTNGFAETWRSSSGTGKGKKRARKNIPDDLGRIPEIEMFVGETRIFSAPNVARIAVGNGSLMSAASLDDKEVIVFANAAGTSSLFIWNRDGRYRRVKINIIPGDTSRVAREIVTFLTAIPKARASVIGDKVVVEGDDIDDQDLEKIRELAKRYPQIINFSNPIGWDQMVLMDVKVVEFPNNELRELGLKWQAMGGTAVGGIWSPFLHGGSVNEYQINLALGNGNAAPITGKGSSGAAPLHSGFNALSVLNMGLNAQLNLLAQDGKAVILASPQLSARNGAIAEFLAGGELPYSVSNDNGTTVVFKEYGIRMKVTPRVGKNGVIRAEVDVEVSSVDSSISTAFGPALLTRKTKTEFNVRSGDTMVLSGLISRSANNDITKVPLLGDIPVLGALFRSKRFQDNQTELVIFVTPSIVDSQSPGLVDRVEQAKGRLAERFGDAPYLSAPLQPGRDSAQPNRILAAVPPAAPDVPVPQPRAETGSEHEFLAGVLSKPQEPDPKDIGKEANPPVMPPVPTPDYVPARPGGGSIQLGTVTARPASSQLANRKYRVTGDNLALRVGPDVNAHVLDRMPAGAEVQSLSGRRHGDWLAIEYNAQWGWAATEYLVPLEGEQ